MKMALNWENLPPIKLVKANDQYILLDGHHRLSAAIYLGKKSIKYYLRKEDD
jgi:ParB-like chromosome segregation protein Spo0J